MVSTTKELVHSFLLIGKLKSHIYANINRATPQISNVVEDVNKAVKAVILNNADAVVFTTNKLGVFGIQAISKMKKRIPEDIAVISFDDTEAYAVAKTSITAIKQPIEQMCKEAVRILMKSIQTEGKKINPERIILDVSFVVRESCP